MDIKICPGLLHGALTPPASKSLCHREIICAALSRGESRLRGVCFSDDILATLRGVSAMGAKIDRSGDELIISGGEAMGLPRIDCGESATTLRLLIPLTLALCGGAELSGAASLMARPLEPYFRIFREKNIEYSLKNNILSMHGRLTVGDYALPGDVSSQFFSGLLLALPLLEDKSILRAESKIQSRPYVDMTLEAMSAHGVDVDIDEHGEAFYIMPQSFTPHSGALESDWSHAALWLTAQQLGSSVEILGLNAGSSQGDRIICEYLYLLQSDGEVEIDVSQCPDIVPPLALAASLRRGRCTIKNAARLRLKECDRLDAVCSVLSSLGADISQSADGLRISGAARLRGGVRVDPRNDHRIAMMAAVAGTVCEEPIIISNADCVSKSYPDFWLRFKELGGAISAV